MHHLYPTSTGDPLCPLGFHPQVRWPTRCKRCFRDYKDHAGKNKPSRKDAISSSPSLSVWEPASGRPPQGSEGKRNWSSTSNLAKDQRAGSSPPENSSVWSSAVDVSTEMNDVEQTVVINTRPKTYSGSQSDSFNFRRFSLDERVVEKPQKLQIKGVIEKSSKSSSDNDAEFIIQVRKSRVSDRNGSSNGPRSESTENVILNGGKSEKSELDKVKSQLRGMRAKCERLEKEKAEILLRRIGTIDSSKTTGSDVLKLQKSVKDLQSKNDTLMEEKSSLASKIKSLERELNLKTHKNERERMNEELRSKLKATETLCESLMDENEDMKKEIRELEEEIYEMHDNFREEQADEYTSLRKNLEQSNKNCRILSFKLRKIERKAEQLETDKIDVEKKYDKTKMIEEILKQVGTEYKNLTKKFTADSSNKILLKKRLDGMETEISDVLSIFVDLMDGKNVGIPNLKSQEVNLKYDKLQKEHEALKQKLDQALKELSTEKETNKSKSNAIPNGSKIEDVQHLKKKLDESQSSRELERKTWDSEKLKLQEEKEKLKSKLLALSGDKLKVHNEVVQLKKELEVASSSKNDNAKMETTLAELKKELTQEKEKTKKLQDELSSYADKESKVSKKLTNVENSKLQLETELKLAKKEVEVSKTSTNAKITELTSELTALKREKEKINSQAEKDKQAKDTEMAALKKKNATLEKANLNAKKMSEMKQTYDERITNLENDLKKVTLQFNELKEKHEKLTEAKSQVDKEKDFIEEKLSEYQKNVAVAQKELEGARQAFKIKESDFLAQTSRLEGRLQEYEKTISMHSQGELRNENMRLKKQSSSLTEQIEDLKKANEDLSSKLNDFNAVTKVHRNFSADTSVLESELRKSKNALANSEKAKKADLAQCKMRYEQRINAINDEIKSTQAQLTKYKRERDTYKQMLEGAQKTIAGLKTARTRRQSSTSTGKSDEDEESGPVNVADLQNQICTMEDELTESKLEASKLKTELVSEQSAWQIKFAELQSHVNELEEERLLASGRTKMPGLKVKMELAWQKEREDQQRLLQETATLARDLRQTLFEMERERDKERLENKRKQDQVKKLFDEEKDENKKKLVELQCDLLELRDAHAKLRTSNEKMRREKERHEREREDLKGIIAGKRRIEQVEARNVNILLQQVDDLMKLFPELNGTVENKNESKPPETYTPTPPRRLKGPKSRESSPLLDQKEEDKGTSVILAGKTEKLEYTIGKLMEVARELQQSKIMVDESSNKSKKLGKRSTSIENDGKNSSNRSKPSLKRKSLSLEQTTGRNEQMIWNTGSNVSSMQSLDGSDVDRRYYSLQRDSSVDSHLSNESTKSEISHRDKKHSKGIMRKITSKLTKSSSNDDPNSSCEFSLQTSGSETSLNDAMKRDKKNLKKKISDIFKRGSKSNGLDKTGNSKENSRPPSRTSTTSTVSAKP